MSGTGGVSGNTPFTFTMQSDRDAILYDSTNTLIYSTDTYYQGATPCRLQMRNDGTFAVIDALNITLSGLQVFSADQQGFLIVQDDGNLVLYNTTLYNTIGPFRDAAIWASGTYDSTPAPFTLVMQEDCNLVLYNGNFPASGPFPDSAIFTSNTYNQGTPFCKLVVNSANGGTIKVVDSKNVVLYTRP
ncbi:hypothetical protein WJX75_000769 [Coccomyxa subellipsoidea]|uniref:Bulb-type lectin domain-containing protein n=1 Tax=Coccomyxa subellipsoidea TaxID=248742 RepID=A0ABR2Z234_9CHLO